MTDGHAHVRPSTVYSRFRGTGGRVHQKNHTAQFWIALRKELSTGQYQNVRPYTATEIEKRRRDLAEFRAKLPA